ncbi:unnamed protein product [Durusdinium trenchii]|uniref:Uncharacterized protein n=2 Tax=Durusdinium trenchii TaxID=1381693 RepID=A0ABP0JST6_9DINO
MSAWLQLQSEPDLPQDLKALRDCSPDDLGCMAQQQACSLATKMASDWPSFPEILEIYHQLQDVCLGRPLSFKTPEDVPGASGQTDSEMSLLSFGECSDARLCTTNVIEYEKENELAKYGMKTGKFAAKAALDVLKETLKSAKAIALRGSVAFAFVGAFISAFFPSAGGLPANPCTFAEDWGRCVWEQVKPFVQEFVSDKLDEAFADIWRATFEGYQTRLWALNATANKNSKKFPNGTIKEMSNKTRDRMHDELKAVHDAMLGSIKLFLADRAIKTTAGAYLSQFASLHVSIMTNLLGSWKYRTEGDRYVFQTVSACYARRVYERATAALKSRTSALEVHEEDNGKQRCCDRVVFPYCIVCPDQSGVFRDTWKLCDWKKWYHTYCVAYVDLCGMMPDMSAKSSSWACYKAHRQEVEKQTVLFWQNWLAPIPVWLNNIVLMQALEVKNGTQKATHSTFDCSAL